MKKRSGTVRRFFGDGSGCVLSVQQEDGNLASLLVEGAVVRALVAQFGEEKGGVMDMAALLGRQVEYVESNTGLVTWLDVLSSGATKGSFAPNGREGWA